MACSSCGKMRKRLNKSSTNRPRPNRRNSRGSFRSRVVAAPTVGVTQPIVEQEVQQASEETTDEG